MNVSGMPFGQTASQEPVTLQAPNPSMSIWVTIDRTRLSCSGLPWGSRLRCDTLADTNSMAEAFLQAATQAPQPMHEAASIASSTVCLGIGNELASGGWPVPTE